MSKKLCLCLGLSLTLTACTFIQRTGTPTPPPTASGSTNQVMPVAKPFFQNGRYAIFSIKLDGTDLREVASSSHQRKQISVSPDDREILYVEYTDDLTKDGLANSIDQMSARLGLMQIDGRDAKLLLNEAAADLSPTFSPDGKFILFARMKEVAKRYLNFDLFRLRKGESVAEQLSESFYWAETDPAWVGNTLAFSSFQINKTLTHAQIILSDEQLDKDTVLTEPLIQTNADVNPAKHFGDYDSQFSPDGTQIAFARYLDNDFISRAQTIGDHDIYLSDLKGNNLLNISNNPEPDLEPAFSPDSSKLAFTRLGEKSSVIMLYDLKKQQTSKLEIPNLNALVSDPCFDAQGRLYFTAEKLF